MIDKLTIRINAIINSNDKTRCGPSLERFLYYLSQIYKIAVLFRHALFKFKIFKSRNLPCFVISIGNLVAGGTGKTPMTIYLARFLTSLGYKIAVVTRGYKGKFEHKGGIVCDGDKILCTQKEAGDEPYMMAHLLKLPLIAGKNRFNAGMTALEKFSPDIIILDDAFQHIALKRDLNLLLLDAKNPLGNHHLLPRGTLREPPSSIERSDAVIYTRSSSNTSKNRHIDNINGILGNTPCFTSDHIPYINKVIPENSFLLSKESTREEISSYVQGKQILLFSGIANNANLKKSCEKMG
ncbi:MAG: tetraacyldisaccharide 4'-kinase, partial [Desulfobacula sp.]|nr:tetraacyldisaccharide 4'-kinase [Desulfobacula sp.]